MNLAYAHHFPERAARPPCTSAVGTINAAVAAARDIDEASLLAPTRGRASIAFARQLCMYLAHTLLGLPYGEVAALFGRDRTTVHYACCLVEDRRDAPEFDQWLTGFERHLLVLLEAAHDDAR